MDIGEETVKWHLKNLFLQAECRHTQARSGPSASAWSVGLGDSRACAVARTSGPRQFPPYVRCVRLRARPSVSQWVGTCAAPRSAAGSTTAPGSGSARPSMFHRNMNASRIPMSAWNLIGDQAQVTTPAASVKPTSATMRPVNASRRAVSLGQAKSHALAVQLHRQQVQRVVDADADAKRDHRQRRHLHADAEHDHQRFAQDRGQRQRQQRHDHRTPRAEGDQAQNGHRRRRRTTASRSTPCARPG